MEGKRRMEIGIGREMGEIYSRGGDRRKYRGTDRGGRKGGVGIQGGKEEGVKGGRQRERGLVRKQGQMKGLREGKREG
jgi:hypothetical protein